jgi:ketosteroid isomerase-like protein
VSEENVELGRQFYAAWNSNDFDFQLAHISPDYEFHLHAKMPGMKEVYKGADGVREFVKDWRETWETLESVVDRIIDVDDERVLGLVHLHGVGREGIELEVEYGHLMTFRDGVAVRLEGILGWDNALRAAGLDE